MNVGDMLYCYKLEPHVNYLTIGNVYTIIGFSGDGERLWIINNNMDEDWYYMMLRRTWRIITRIIFTL